MGKNGSLLALASCRNERQANVPMSEAPYLPRGIVHNAWLYGVAGLGALINERSECLARPRRHLPTLTKRSSKDNIFRLL